MQARHLLTLDHVLTLLGTATGTSSGTSSGMSALGLTVVIARNQKQLTRLRCDNAGLPPGSLRTLVGRKSGQLTEQLIGLPPIALVIDSRSPKGPQQGKLFEAAFFVLDPGARWVALLDEATLGAASPQRQEPGGPSSGKVPQMERVGRRFEAAARTGDVRPRWRTHLRSSDQVVVTPELVSIRKGRGHLLKIRDADALTLLPQREPDLDVHEIASHEVSTLTTHDHVHYGEQRGEQQVPDVMESPRLTLRRYDGAVTLPVNALAYHGRTLLPDSFRWHLSEVPTAWGIKDTGSRFARLQPHPPAQHLEGSYFHFGYNNSGHFGHLMTEALAKLWGWQAAKDDDPSLKILCRVHPERQQRPSARLETRLLPAYGIAPEDIAWADGPVTVDRLYSGTPMWHNTVPFYAHEGLREDWARLRDGMLRGADATPGPSKIFVTRRSGHRLCRNVEQVEAIFEAAGYTVVHPQALALADQVALFASARVVAGFGGAGMFNLAYARQLEAVVILNQWAYEARNEQLYAAVHDAACHTFWSKPDIDHPPGGSAYRAHQSDWEFDLGLSGELSALLADL
ncbi:hypothetical protein BH09ACT12_BH09ACT12_00910 [soil metagenome]